MPTYYENTPEHNDDRLRLAGGVPYPEQDRGNRRDRSLDALVASHVHGSVLEMSAVVNSADTIGEHLGRTHRRGLITPDRVAAQTKAKKGTRFVEAKKSGHKNEAAPGDDGKARRMDQVPTSTTDTVDKLMKMRGRGK